MFTQDQIEILAQDEPVVVDGVGYSAQVDEDGTWQILDATEDIVVG